MSAKTIKWKFSGELNKRVGLTSSWTHWSTLTSLKLEEAHPNLMYLELHSTVIYAWPEIEPNT